MEKDLTLNEYQTLAMTTCMSTCNNFSYMAFNLAGELGEFCSKVAKAIRRGEAMIDNNNLITERGDKVMSNEELLALKAEAGDCLWQLAGLCKVMGWSLEDVAMDNLAKLASRKDRGVISGNGDNR